MPLVSWCTGQSQNLNPKACLSLALLYPWEGDNRDLLASDLAFMQSFTFYEAIAYTLSCSTLTKIWQGGY